MAEELQNFIKAIGGEVLQEASGLVADRVREFRFRNQVAIFRRTDKFLREANLPRMKVATKLLVPLIECASLEDDPDLQELWAKLLAAAASDPRVSLHSITLDVLKGISSLEAAVLKALHAELTQRPHEQFVDIRRLLASRPPSPFLDLEGFVERVGKPKEEVYLALDNLGRYNLFTVNEEVNLDGKRTGHRQLVMTRLGMQVLDLLMNPLRNGSPA